MLYSKGYIVPPFSPAEWHIFLVICNIGLNGMSGTTDYQINRSIWPGIFTLRSEIMKPSPSLSCKTVTVLFLGSQCEFLVKVTKEKYSCLPHIRLSQHYSNKQHTVVQVIKVTEQYSALSL